MEDRWKCPDCGGWIAARVDNHFCKSDPSIKKPADHKFKSFKRSTDPLDSAPAEVVPLAPGSGKGSVACFCTGECKQTGVCPRGAYNQHTMFGPLYNKVTNEPLN